MKQRDGVSCEDENLAQRPDILHVCTLLAAVLDLTGNGLEDVPPQQLLHSTASMGFGMPPSWLALQ